MPNIKQDEDFVHEMIPYNMLEMAIGWIAYNLNPEDVFKEEDLEKWALENGFREEED